jgi:FkbM family methyltransferase
MRVLVVVLLLCSTPWSCAAATPEINAALLQRLIAKYTITDPLLKVCANQFPFQSYAIATVEEKDLFYIDDKPDLIKTHHTKKGLAWEGWMRAEMKKYVRPGSVVIDIGGHMGTHALNLSRIVGPAGTVHVFEPQAKLFCELVINMYLNHVKNAVLHRTALGNERKWAQMAPPNPINEGNTCMGAGGEYVKMERLDDYHFQDVSFIKIDVEGFEMQVIEGARETICRSKPIMIVEIWHGLNDPIVGLLRGLGYGMVRLSHMDWLCFPTTWLAPTGGLRGYPRSNARPEGPPLPPR